MTRLFRRPAPAAILGAAAGAWLALVLGNYVTRAVIPNAWPWEAPAAWPPGGPGGLAALFFHVRALLAAALLLLAATGGGDSLLAWLAPARRAGAGLAHRALAAVAGLGLAGQCFLGLGYVGLVRFPVLAVLLAAGGALALLRPAPALPRRPAGVRPLFGRMLALAAAAALAGALLGAFAPETDPDSLKYHLTKAARYARDGRLALQADTFDRWPSLWETLLSGPFALAGEPAAKCLNPLVVLLGGALLWGTIALESPLGGGIAAALWVTGYDAARLSATSKNDLLIALFILAAFAAPRLRGGGRRGTALAGFFLGCAAATKLTAGAGIVVTALLTVYGAPRRRGRDAAGRAAALGLAGLAGAVPWLLRDWLATGNPFYPFLAGVFGTGFTPGSGSAIVFADEAGHYVAGTYGTVAAKLRAAWSVAITERHMLLPVLVLPACLLSLSRRARAAPWAVAGLGIMAAWAFAPPMPRFLVQALPLLCGAAELAIADPRLGPGTRAAGLAVAVAVAGLEGARGWADIWTDRVSRAGVAVGAADPAAYRLDRLKSFAEAVAWVNGHLPMDSRVIVFGDVRVHPIDRRTILRAEFQPFSMLELAADSGNAARLDRRIRQAGVSHLLYDRIAAIGRGAHFEILLPPDRALPVWAAWWRKHAVLLHESPAFDLWHGAFFVYALGARTSDDAGATDAAYPSGATLVLPGIEGWLHRAERLRQGGRRAEARAAFARIEAAAGDFAIVQQARVAIFEADLPRAEARRTLKAVEARGLRSVWLMTTLARLAADAGDAAEARRYSRKADALVWKP